MRTAVAASNFASHRAWRPRHLSPVTHHGVTETVNGHLKPRGRLHQRIFHGPWSFLDLEPGQLHSSTIRNTLAQMACQHPEYGSVRQDPVGFPSSFSASPNVSKPLDKRPGTGSSAYGKGPKSRGSARSSSPASRLDSLFNSLSYPT